MTGRGALSEELRLLGLTAKAEWAEIQSAYRRKALELHPDLHHPSAGGTDTGEFRRVNEAFERLRARHIDEQLQGDDHIMLVSSDPIAAELPPEELELRIRFSASPHLRAASSILLAQRAGEGSRAALRCAARDDDPQVRRAALEALRKIGARWDLTWYFIRDALRRVGAKRPR